MPTEITYVPTAEFRPGPGTAPDQAGNIARRLKDREIPTCHIRREPGLSLPTAINAAENILGYGILPVVEIHPGDDTAQIRILAESCTVGTLALSWEDGEPKFDSDAMLETLNGAGRHRLPVDLWIDPGKIEPESQAFNLLVSEIETLAKKYGHIQVVMLVGAPIEGNEATDREKVGVFGPVFNACPNALAAVALKLWTARESVRKISRDLGSVIYPSSEIEDSSSYMDPLGPDSSIGKKLGVEVLPRLPLTPRLYRLGWHSFDVGKVLDAWIDRKAYERYRIRPGWLEY